MIQKMKNTKTMKAIINNKMKKVIFSLLVILGLCFTSQAQNVTLTDVTIHKVNSTIMQMDFVKMDLSNEYRKTFSNTQGPISLGTINITTNSNNIPNYRNVTAFKVITPMKPLVVPNKTAPIKFNPDVYIIQDSPSVTEILNKIYD